MAYNKFQLYINKQSPASLAAVANMQNICKEYLTDDCELEIIDIHEQPEKMEEAGILAIPTLIRTFPLPLIRIIGALGTESRVLIGLGIAER